MPHRWIPVEETFNAFVQEFGGSLVTNLIPSTNCPQNTDYVFNNPPIVAELKCLEKETLNRELAEKLGQLFENWRRRNLIRIYGRARVDLRRVPLVCQREWLDLLETPLQRNVVAKANKQIKATKEMLSMPNAKGVLIVASDGNYSLSLTDLMNLTARVLKKTHKDGRPQYSAIEWVVFFSANMTVKSPSGLEVLPWVSAWRYENDALISEFLSRLREGWIKYLAKTIGKEIKTVVMDHRRIENITFNKPEDNDS